LFSPRKDIKYRTAIGVDDLIFSFEVIKLAILEKNVDDYKFTLAGAFEKLTAPGKEFYATSTQKILSIDKLTAVASVMMSIISCTTDSSASLYRYCRCNIQNIL
jgi:hypothetical protein